MDVYAHFELAEAPFESAPDPRFYFDTPDFAETIATLEFAQAARKPCVLVVGPPGAGKSVIAQRVAAGLAPHGRVLRLDPFDAHARATCGDDAAPRPLSAWLNGPAVPTALLVDDADQLHAGAWRCLAALLSRPGGGGPVVMLFGTPELWRRLSSGPFERIAARVFRTCVLGPWKDARIIEYIAHRLRVAGNGARRLIDNPALAEIARWAAGNPGKANRLCDNALIEAFSAGRQTVGLADVQAGLVGLTGGAPLATLSAELAPAALPAPPTTALATRPAALPQAAPAGDHGRLDDMESRLTRVLDALRAARAGQLRLVAGRGATRVGAKPVDWAREYA